MFIIRNSISNEREGKATMSKLKTRPLVEEEQIEYGLERELRQANFTRMKRDQIQTVRNDLISAGEDLRDWPLKRILGLIEKGFLG